MGKVDFDRYAEDYDRLLADQVAFFDADSSYFAQYKVQLLKERLRHQPKRILEYGCGIGRNIGFLINEFPTAEVFGCDISSKSLDIAREKYPKAEFFLVGEEGDALKFDLVFVAGVFHHVPSDERPKVLADIGSYLESGGTLFVTEHNPFNPVTRRLVNACPYDEDAELIRLSTMKKCLADSGFRIIEARYYLFFPKMLSMLRRFEHLLGSVPMGGQYFIHAVK